MELLGVFLFILAFGILLYGLGVSNHRSWDTKSIQDLSRKRRKQEELEYKAKKTSEIEELPSPKPFVGHISLLRSNSNFFVAQHEIAKRFGRLVPMYLGSLPVLLVTDPAVIREVMVEQFEHFRNRSRGAQLRETTGMVFARDGIWKRMRRTVSPTFSLARMKPMAAVINAKARLLTDRLESVLNGDSPNTDVDIHDLLSRLTLDVIGETAFATRLNSLIIGSSLTPEDALSVSGESQKNTIETSTPETATSILNAARQLLAGSASRFRPSQFLIRFLPLSIRSSLIMHFRPDVAHNVNVLDSHAFEMVKKRREDHEKSGKPEMARDFLDLLLTAKDSESGLTLSDREIADQCNTFLIAGSDTTSNTLSYAIYLLAQYPQVEEALLSEINKTIVDKVTSNSVGFEDLKNLTYLDSVIRETLRVFPAVGTTIRECSEGIVLPKSGIHIPKGSEVHVPIWSIHHDPLYWEEPDLFKPERWITNSPSSTSDEPSRQIEHFGAGSAGSPGPWYAFGAGPRSCIGMKFALMEAKMVLATLIYNFKFQLTRRDTQIPLKLNPGITITPAEGIWVTFERRTKPTMHYV